VSGREKIRTLKNVENYITIKKIKYNLIYTPRNLQTGLHIIVSNIIILYLFVKRPYTQNANTPESHMHRITTFWSTTDRIYDGGPIRLHHNIKFYIIL